MSPDGSPPACEPDSVRDTGAEAPLPRPVFAVGAAGACLCVVLFVALAFALDDPRAQRFDDGVLRWFAQHRSVAWTRIFLSITSLGSVALLTLLTLGISVGFWLAARRRMALALGAAMVGSAEVSALLKAFYGRARPSLVTHLEDVRSGSFPSGHTVGSVVFCTTLVLLAYEHIRRPALRRFVAS